MSITGGAIGKFQRLGLRQQLESLLWQQLPVYIPETTACTAPGCGLDSLSQSGLNPSCLVCGGRGVIITWQVGYVTVRHQWVDLAHIDYFRGLLSGEVGDCTIQGKMQDLALFNKMYATEGAYFLLDERRLHPISITINHVEGNTTINIRTAIITGAKP